MARVGQVGKAIYDFDGNQGNHELTLRIGELVELEDLSIGKGWWQVRHKENSRSGLVPTWSIQLLPDDFETSSENKNRTLNQGKVQNVDAQNFDAVKVVQNFSNNKNIQTEHQTEHVNKSVIPVVPPRPTELSIDDIFTKRLDHKDEDSFSETPTNEDHDPFQIQKHTFSSNITEKSSTHSSLATNSFSNLDSIKNSQSFQTSFSNQNPISNTDSNLAESLSNLNTSSSSSTGNLSFFQSITRKSKKYLSTSQTVKQYNDFNDNTRTKQATKPLDQSLISHIHSSSNNSNSTVISSSIGRQSSSPSTLSTSRLTRSFRHKLGHRRIKSEQLNSDFDSISRPFGSISNAQAGDGSSLSGFKRSSSLRGSIKNVIKTHPAVLWCTSKRCDKNAQDLLPIFMIDSSGGNTVSGNKVSHNPKIKQPYKSLKVEHSDIITRKLLRPIIQYSITVNTDVKVIRHAKQFLFIQENLEKQFCPILHVPKLPLLLSNIPEAQNWTDDSRVDESNEELRGAFGTSSSLQEIQIDDALKLQFWLEKIASHPILGKTRCLEIFLSSTDEETWKNGKRVIEKLAQQSQTSRKLGYKYRFLDELDADFYKNSIKDNEEIIGSGDSVAENDCAKEVLENTKLAFPTPEYLQILKTCMVQLSDHKLYLLENTKIIGKLFEKQISTENFEMSNHLSSLTNNYLSILQHHKLINSCSITSTLPFQLSNISTYFASESSLIKGLGQNELQNIVKELRMLEDLQKSYLDTISEVMGILWTNFKQKNDSGDKAGKKSWDETSLVESRAEFLIAFLNYDIYHSTTTSLKRLTGIYYKYLGSVLRYHEAQAARIKQILEKR